MYVCWVEVGWFRYVLYEINEVESKSNWVDCGGYMSVWEEFLLGIVGILFEVGVLYKRGD